jgi:hypothetical protein
MELTQAIRQIPGIRGHDRGPYEGGPYSTLQRRRQVGQLASGQAGREIPQTCDLLEERGNVVFAEQYTRI